MRTDHRPPLQEFGYAVLPDWQPKRPVNIGLLLLEFAVVVGAVVVVCLVVVR